jgi:RNA polymerase sigma-54 factor
MKQTLQLRLGQQLTMTPQLQQAIKLLQMSTLDLQQEIQQALDSNMMLEVADDDNALPQEIAEPTESISQRENEFSEIPNLDEKSDIPQELPGDSSWEDVYDTVQSYTSSSHDDADDDYLFQRAPVQTLQDYLQWQLEMSPVSEHDYAIATAIIDSINDDGYLTGTLEDIHQGLLEQIEDLEFDEVVAVLHRVQNFDPVGVAAVDLADCLTLQLKQMPNDTPWKDKALLLVKNHLEALAKRDMNKLRRALELEDDDINQVVSLIRSLEPKPGRRIAPTEHQYIIPDVLVIRVGHHWQVSLNPEIAPKLRVNPFYSNMIKRADHSTDNTTMKNHLQEARWFIKSLQSRNETLLKVAKSIVEQQKEFLEYGEKAMKPLVLRDIAEEVGMHESTISRVTTQKYMHTPNGIFEFKYFFSSHVSTESGGECSATAIKALIKEIVEQEDNSKPLSDDAISKMLKAKGINVARRTVAKYREALSIASSNERKRTF